MRIFSIINKALRTLWLPVEKNGLFCITMFILGMICTQTEVTKHVLGAKPYEWSVPELLLDIYIAAAILTAIPSKIRCWIRRIVYTILYATAIADLFCYIKFDSTLTPTMLMLVGETTGSESSEFLDSYITTDLLSTTIGWVLLLMLVHLVINLTRFLLRKQIIFNKDWCGKHITTVQSILGVIVLAQLIYSGIVCWDNKVAMTRMFTKDSVAEIEREQIRKDGACFYLPINRLAFSLFANHEANKQLDVLAETTKHIQVSHCTFRSPNIVLIIGESYNKHHSQLYGYDMPTTKFQSALAKQGSLTPFSDVIAPWNLTSYVFKMMLSTYTVGDTGEWCDYPLFPQLFRKAGYHVSFITNQFQSKAGEQVYDFSGGFFLNNPEVSQSMFDTRNTSLHPFDDGVLEDYDQLKSKNTAHNLIILHLMGQHVMYKQRYPDNHKALGPKDYMHRALSMHDRYVLADYDNATRYNDSIVYEAIHRFIDQDAIVIYMPDHGEEAFGDDLHVYGRQHTSHVDWRMAKEEFQIPFWIWCSPSYAKNHPDIVKAIHAAKDKPLMTDRIAHTLLGLAGISTPAYKSSADVLRKEYDTQRPRYIKREVNYDALKNQHTPKEDALKKKHNSKKSSKQ